MLLPKGLLGLVAVLALSGPTLPTDPSAEQAGAGPRALVGVGLWELVVEHVSFPLGPATPRERTVEVVWW